MKSIQLQLAVLAVAAVSSTAASQALYNPVHPATYASPNGEFRLHVNPTHWLGAGPAEYHLTRRDGATVWRGSRDFTLVDVTVTDRGEAAGHGYWRGFHGVTDPFERNAPEASPPTRPADSRPTESRPKGSASTEDRAFVVYLTEAGTPRICQVFPRRLGGNFHGSPALVVTSVSIDSESDRLTSLVRDQDPASAVEESHLYLHRLSTGELLLDLIVDKEHSNDDAFDFVFAARAIRGTPLTVVHGMGSDGTASSRFAAFDLTGQCVWTRVLPEDLENKDGTPRLSLKLHRGRALLGSSKSKEFTIRTFATPRSVTFGVEQARDGTWEFRQLQSEAFVETPNPTTREVVHSRPALTQVPARVKGDLWLKAKSAAAGPIHDISALTTTADGSLSFLQIDPSTNQRRFVVVHPSSRATRTIELSSGSASVSDYAPVSKDRWLLVAEDRDSASDRNTLYTYWLDTKTGACTKTDVPPMFASMGIAGLGEGRFAVLGTRVENFVPTPRLTVYHEGKAVWSVGIDESNGLYIPQALCVTSRGEIAVLESEKRTVKFFGASRERLPSIDLAQRWGRAPESLAALTADVDGGVLVHDRTGTPSILRMRPDGTVLGSWTPTLDDGQALRSPVVATPTGQLWATDGQCLYRLDNTGRVVETLGARLTGPQLEGVAALAFGPRGEINALSSTTGAVHAYDSSGEPLRVAVPDAADLLRPISEYWSLTADPAGSLYVAYGDEERPQSQFVRFDAQGKRLGIDTIVTPFRWLSAHRQPLQPRSWLIGATRIALTDDRGAILRTIERDPNDRWLPRISDAAQSGDGSLAVFLAGENVFDPDAPETEEYTWSTAPRFLILDNGGRIVKVFDWPDGLLYETRLAFDGKRLAYLTRRDWNLRLVVVSTLDGTGFEFPIDGTIGNLRGVVLPDGLDEAWVYSNTRVIKRYAIDRK